MEPNPPEGNPDSTPLSNQSADDFVGININRGLCNLSTFLHKNRNWGPSPPRWSSLYEIERCYGGPEEGGWWYDWLTPVACVREPFSQEDRRAMLERFRNEHGAVFRDDEIDGIKIPAHWSASPRRATHIVLDDDVPFSESSHTVPHYE